MKTSKTQILHDVLLTRKEEVMQGSDEPFLDAMDTYAQQKAEELVKELEEARYSSGQIWEMHGLNKAIQIIKKQFNLV